MRKSLILAATFLIACEDIDSQLVVTHPIDSKIIIETRELLSEDARDITFYCKTEKIYPCMNFPLSTQQRIDKNSVRIAFTAVEELTTCFTALGPATTSVELGSLPNGHYALDLNNGDLRNSGALEVTDTDISIQLDQEDGIEVVRRTTKRVPWNTYWGRVGYHKASSSVLVDAFLEKLAAAGALFNKQAPGHYFYYEIDSAGEIITVAEHSGHHFVKAFIFQYEGNESDLYALIRNNYSGQLSITVETFKGSVVNNYQ